MSSSVWSISTGRSSSSLSWEEECDEESRDYLQSLLETIDKVVFFDEEVPQEFSQQLSQECLIWRKKFAEKVKNTNPKGMDKMPHKLKSLSAPKINIKFDSQPRSLSQQTFTSEKTKLQSIPKNNKTVSNGNGMERYFPTVQKPLILPPIVNYNQSKKHIKPWNGPNIPTVPIRPNTSVVPNVPKIFPKPLPVLSIDQILSRPTDLTLEANVTKIEILPHFNKFNKQTNRTFPPVLHK